MSDLHDLIDDFEKVTEIATDLSMHFDGVNTRDRKRKLSTYFLAKLVHNCVSLLRVLPKKGEDDSYFDFSSVASIGRNIIEATNLCWYYCLDEVDKSESDFRFILFDYHDICTLMTISDSFNWSLDEKDRLEYEKVELQSVLKSCPQYIAQDSASKKQLRQGRKASLYTQNELIELRGINTQEFRGIYKLLSNHVHTTPSSINSLVHSRLNGQGMDRVLCGLTLAYVCSFTAEMVKSVGNIWCMEFAKEESQYIVDSYSAQLFEIT